VLKYWLDPDNTGVTKMGGWALSIKDQAGQTDIKLYPNPAHQAAYLDFNDESLIQEGVNISLTDILGNQLPSSIIAETAQGRYSFELKSLSPGIYFIIISGHNFRKSMKLIKM
jgi:hypothetical protein